MRYIILLAAFITFGSSAFADNDKFYLNKLNFCKITKKSNNDYEPEIFQTSNNLLRTSGESQVYCGQKIIIHGRVLDEKCTPVADAKVYLWQVGCDGKYPYKPLKGRVVNKKLIGNNKHFTFTGNGTATTNNKGEFTFVTIYPESVHRKRSHVNVRVEHRNLGSLQTILALKGREVKNPIIHPELDQSIKQAAKGGIRIYDFNIVIPGDGIKRY